MRESSRSGIEGEAEACQRKCTEVLFFITKDFRLKYISVQGRVLLIYCYLMTMIFFFFSFFYFFFIGKRMFFVTSVCLFHDVHVTWIGGKDEGLRLAGTWGLSALQISHTAKISSHWRNKKCTRLPWGCAFLPLRHVYSIMFLLKWSLYFIFCVIVREV